mmetsp:Transcript_2699/g.5718  ORF Transcript_2699/g.5718 Transcript_2699/m.5718 type:complete len:86 (-) Transcript_2699:1547-1804(-)
MLVPASALVNGILPVDGVCVDATGAINTNEMIKATRRKNKLAIFWVGYLRSVLCFVLFFNSILLDDLAGFIDKVEHRTPMKSVRK